MLLAILLTLATHPLGAPTPPQAEVCEELRAILPDLLRIDRTRGHSQRHVVSAARVRTLEARLGSYLGLPQGLQVKLTTISGRRREVAKNGSITAWVHHRATGMGLGHAVIAWSGERVRVPGLSFRRAEAEPVASGSRNEMRRHFSMADLSGFYQRLDELMVIVDSPKYAIEGIFSFSGSPSAVPPFCTARVGIRRPCDLGEKCLTVRATLPLREAPVTPAEGEMPGAAGPYRLYAGPARRPVAIDEALDIGIEILEQLEFSFQHSIQLSHSRKEPLVYELRLDPYKKEHTPLSVSVHIHKGKDEDARWYVTDTQGQLARESVELRTFVALMNRVVPILVQRGERIGVLGLAQGSGAGGAEALLVTVDAESIWAAKKGQLYVMSANPEGEVAVVERDELSTITPGEPVMYVREALSSTGKRFHLYVPVRGEVFMANPPPRALRYGELSFTPVGGNLSN